MEPTNPSPNPTPPNPDTGVVQPPPEGITSSAPSAAPEAPKPANPEAKAADTQTADSGKGLTKEFLLEMVFVIGFSTIFLINAMNAFYSPSDFAKLLTANPITRSIGYYDLMTKIIMFNDLFLGILILTRWKKKYVWAWAGAWLIMVAGIKGLYLVGLRH